MSARPWARRRIFPGTFEVREIYKSRYPIEKLYCPDLPVEARRGQASKVAREVVADAFPRRLEQEIGRLFEKGRVAARNDSGSTPVASKKSR